MTVPADPLRDFEIPYATVASAGPEVQYFTAVANLTEILPQLWIDSYTRMSSHEPRILEFADHGFVFLFDFTSGDLPNDAVTPSGPRGQLSADRVVAVYGRTTPPRETRDASRTRGFLGGPIVDRQRTRRDKGHFAAHTLGGALDVNLFPQLSAVNRGWSPRGKVFRQMERYGARYPGTFVFSRPIYVDDSWTPAALEYGVLREDFHLWVERFPN